MAEGYLNQVQVKGILYNLVPVCDKELDESSENAVQNSVVTKAIQNLIDSSPEEIANEEIDFLFPE